MIEPPCTTTLNNPEQTADLARKIGDRLIPGDCLLLDGPIGAGKTHFARALIQSLQDRPEDVPSPTFTLVQTYQTRRGEIWHADLYRLTHGGEVEELGLEEAFDQAICLVEWPDRLGAVRPKSALDLAFWADTDRDDQRHLKMTWRDPKWAQRLAGVMDD